MKLKAHHNVICLAEQRRMAEQRAADLAGESIMLVNFVGLRACEPENAPPAAPERRQRPKWLRVVLGLAKRSRPF